MLQEILSRPEIAEIVEWFAIALEEAHESEIRVIEDWMSDEEAVQCDPYARLGYELHDRLWVVLQDDDLAAMVGDHIIGV